jgi:hypothetical protein
MVPTGNERLSAVRHEAGTSPDGFGNANTPARCCGFIPVKSAVLLVVVLLAAAGGLGTWLLPAAQAHLLRARLGRARLDWGWLVRTHLIQGFVPVRHRAVELLEREAER